MYVCIQECLYTYCVSKKGDIYLIEVYILYMCTKISCTFIVGVAGLALTISKP